MTMKGQSVGDTQRTETHGHLTTELPNTQSKNQRNERKLGGPTVTPRRRPQSATLNNGGDDQTKHPREPEVRPALPPARRPDGGEHPALRQSGPGVQRTGGVPGDGARGGQRRAHRCSWGTSHNND